MTTSNGPCLASSGNFLSILLNWHHRLGHLCRARPTTLVHQGGVTTWRSWAAVAVIAGEPAAGTRAVVGEAALSWANVRTHTGPREAWGGWERSRRSSPTRLQWRLREEDGDVETKAVGPPGSEARRARALGRVELGRNRKRLGFGLGLGPRGILRN